MDDNSRLVYSTEYPVPRKEKQPEHKRSAAAPFQGRTVVRLDRKGRGGKTVTVIESLHLPERDCEKLLKQLKAKLGTGGAAKNGALEIQGDHADAVMAQLSALGYSPKRSGG